MELTLPLVTFLAAGMLLLLGVCLLLDRPGWRSALQAFPRSLGAAVVTLGLGAGWFLWKVAHLTPVDFGDYKVQLLILFGGVAVGSFFVARDFLAVRGLSILTLLLCNEVLKTAFGHYELPQRLPLVALAYLLICLALWLGASPFRLRDFIAWAFAQGRRARLVGMGLCIYGMILLGTALSYYS